MIWRNLYSKEVIFSVVVKQKESEPAKDLVVKTLSIETGYFSFT